MQIRARVGSGCWIDEMQIKEKNEEEENPHLHRFHFDHVELRTVSPLCHAGEL